MFIRRTGVSAAAILFCLTIAAFILQAGCAPKQAPLPSWEQDAAALLDQASSLFAKKAYEQAMQTAEAAMYRYPQSRQRDRALLLMGDIRFSLRDYAKALNYYKELIQEFPASSFLAAAKYKLGQCYFELKEYDLAIANLEDRSRISDPAQLVRIAEMLSAAYEMKKNFGAAVKEYSYLAAHAATETRKAGYRDRVREMIDRSLSDDELKTLAAEQAYPADLARLRLAGRLVEQRRYHEAISLMKEFIEKFPNHPERTRAELLINEATTKLSSPRYYLGALLPQTGQLAVFGDRVLKGVQLAVNAYNGKNPEDRVDVLVRDTEGSPEKAAAALKDLAAKGALAAIGPLLTKEAEAIAPLLATVKIPVITPAASGEGIGKLSPWLFRDALTNGTQAAAAAQAAFERKCFRAVILYPDDAYGRDLARLFTRDIENKAQVLASIAYPPEVKDFGPYVRKLMEIDLRSRKIPIPDDDAERKKLFQDYTPGFDTIYLPGYAERIGLLIPQLAFYNISGITMIGSNNWHGRDLIERAQKFAENAVFVDGFFPESDDPAVRSFVDSYRSAYQDEPDILAAQAYDSTTMALSLLHEHKDTPQAIRDGLAGIRDFPGISGITTFGASSGDAQKKLFLLTVHDNGFVLAPAVK